MSGENEEFFAECYLRGHQIFWDGETYRYCDSKEIVPTDRNKHRPCYYCGREPTKEGHDGCLGTLKGVRNACCGHGVKKDAYIQLYDGTTLRGIVALEEITRIHNEAKR